MDDLKVIASRALKSFVEASLTDIVCDDSASEVELDETEYRDLHPGRNHYQTVIGRVRNPQQLGDLDVIHMDFVPRTGEETKLLILYAATRPDMSISDIIQQEYADVGLVTVKDPVLDGKVLVACTPCYVERSVMVGGGRRDYAALAASYHLRTGRYERALRMSDNSLEGLYVKGQAATRLQLYDVAIEAYREALGLSSPGSGKHSATLQTLERVKQLREQAYTGNFETVPDDGEMPDYVSKGLETRFDQERGTVDVFAKEPVASGQLVVVSNGIQNGPNAFAMVLDACGRSTRLLKQVELLWFYKLRIRKKETDVHEIASSFKPPQAVETADLFVDMSIIWCVMKRARMKGNASSLWPFPCFFSEVADDSHNVEVQVKGRTMLLRARRDIEAGEMLNMPAKEDVVQTRFFYDGDGTLVREQIRNCGNSVSYKAWGMYGEGDELPPADTDWQSFIENPSFDCHSLYSFIMQETDVESSEDVVARLFAKFKQHNIKARRTARRRKVQMFLKKQMFLKWCCRRTVKRHLRLAIAKRTSCNNPTRSHYNPTRSHS